MAESPLSGHPERPDARRVGVGYMARPVPFRALRSCARRSAASVVSFSPLEMADIALNHPRLLKDTMTFCSALRDRSPEIAAWPLVPAGLQQPGSGFDIDRSEARAVRAALSAFRRRQPARIRSEAKCYFRPQGAQACSAGNQSASVCVTVLIRSARAVLLARPSLWLADPAEESGLLRRGHPGAGFGHWAKHRHLHDGQRSAAQALSLIHI